MCIDHRPHNLPPGLARPYSPVLFGLNHLPASLGIVNALECPLMTFQPDTEFRLPAVSAEDFCFQLIKFKLTTGDARVLYGIHLGNWLRYVPKYVP